jgi:lipopolysaccharide export system protein LptA
MPLDPQRLRRWFAAVAIAAIALSLAYYFYARMHLWREAERGSGMMGVEVQQSTQGFTLSKSEAGRTIFTVHASQAVQYKAGGRAELHDVSILVYGRGADRFDQIYGNSFEYDPQSGDIIAHGEVAIDLEGDAQGPVRPDQAAPVELKNPIQLKTSGLAFNQKTGRAVTREKIEFRMPQASGSAVGASYDSKSNTLMLSSEVRVETLEGANIQARRAIFTQNPRRVLLHTARIEQPTSDVQAGQLTFYLRDDNTISRMLAAGEVQGVTRGLNPARVEAGQGEFTFGPKKKNQIQSGELAGGVEFQQDGTSPVHGTAGRAALAFSPRGSLTHLNAMGGVQFVQNQRATASQNAQSVELASDRLDLLFSAGRLERGVTGGAAKITLRPQTRSTQGDTIISAGHFDMTFGADNRLAALHGEPDARIVSSTPGQPDQVSTSRKLDATFDLKGDITGVSQQGNVRYTDAQRSAFADQVRYTPTDQNLALTGSARWSEAGETTTARVLKLNRRSGEAVAEGEVRTTYLEKRPQPSGALLSGSEPIHVTADKMNARRQTGNATYSGSARLWQGTNIIEATVIEFNRDSRLLRAEGTRQPATLVFVQSDGKGKHTRVTATASSMSYSDGQHRAVLRGGVLLRSADGTIKADDAEVLFAQANQESAGKSNLNANKIDVIVAQGHVVARQPTRQVVGDKLVYTVSDGKYVMTGGQPSIFDAERGVTSGDSLTFYSRGDTVLVGSESSTRTVTKIYKSK